MVKIIIKEFCCNSCPYDRLCNSLQENICTELSHMFGIKLEWGGNWFRIYTSKSKSEVEARVALFKIKYPSFPVKVEIT